MKLTHTGTQEIETERLRLRRFVMEDVNMVFLEWANSEAVTKYLTWERHKSLGETRTWLLSTIASYEQEGIYSWGIELKETSGLIGSIGVGIKSEHSRVANVGYCLGERFWGSGYMTEALRAVIDYMLYDVNVNRIEAYHSVNNPASGKVMQKAGMLKEGCSRQNYLTGDEYQDSDLYALVQDDFDRRYVPENRNFFELDDKDISKHNVRLLCHEYYPGNTAKKYVPSYKFNITEKNSGTILGGIDLRLGFTEGLYYGGHIGYSVKEEFRNMGVATIACKIVLQVAKAHGYKRVIITNTPSNRASVRVCEKVGAKLIRVAKLPLWNEMYKEGDRYKNIYEVNLAVDLVNNSGDI